MRPSSLALDGTRYLIAPGANAYRIVYESNLVARRVEAGGERGEREIARRDLLPWTWSEWGGGEGQEFIDTRKKNTFNKYYISGGAVDIRRSGRIRLGLALSVDLNIADVDVGPFLAAAGRPVVAYSTAAGTERWNRREAGTWGTSAVTGNAASLRGQIAAINNKVFIGSTTDIVRVNAALAPAAGTTWTSVSGHGVLVADNRLYFGDPTAAENLTLKVVDLQPSSSAPFTPTTIGTVGGWDDSEGLANDGNKIYFLVGANNERLGIFTINGTDTDTFKEFARLPEAFRISAGQRRQIVTLNGVVFVGGYFKDPHGAVDDPALVWATDQGSGVVGRIRERGNNERITVLYATIDNEVLMGTSKGNVFAYNMNTGGFYQFASGMTTDDSVIDFTYDDGLFFVATNSVSAGDADVWATKTSGTGKYPASVKVDGSKWDFDTDARKVLLEVAVSGSFPASTSAEFSFSFDGGAEVTTDSAGATMVANTTGTTVFTISSASVERTGFILKPFITLKTSATGSTPTIYEVAMKATTFDKAKFIECSLDLRQPNSQHPPGDAISGAAAAAEIESLIESSSSRIVSVEAQWEKAQPPYSRTVDTYNCIIDEASIETDAPGSAIARLRLRVLS